MTVASCWIASALALSALTAGCSLIERNRDGATTVARGARTVVVETARAGALVSRLIAANTYHGGRKAVTWTGRQTAEGTAATLDLLGLGQERPAPPDLLERLPEELLKELSALEFVRAERRTGLVVIDSRDTRWEGEVFYTLEAGQGLELVIEGPAELIVVSLAAFPPPEDPEARPAPPGAGYCFLVREDGQELGEVRIEGTSPAPGLGIYGYQGWRVAEPGVFMVRTGEGARRYRFELARQDRAAMVLISFYRPRYQAPDAP